MIEGSTVISYYFSSHFSTTISCCDPGFIKNIIMWPKQLKLILEISKKSIAINKLTLNRKLFFNSLGLYL